MDEENPSGRKLGVGNLQHQHSRSPQPDQLQAQQVTFFFFFFLVVLRWVVMESYKLSEAISQNKKNN